MLSPEPRGPARSELHGSWRGGLLFANVPPVSCEVASQADSHRTLSAEELACQLNPETACVPVISTQVLLPSPVLLPMIFFTVTFFFFKRGEGGEREVDLLLHPFMYSLVDSVRDQTLTLGTTGQYSNQLSYPARAPGDF